MDEDENDRCDECMDGRHMNCTDVEDGSCCCPPGPDRHYFPEADDEDPSAITATLRQMFAGDLTVDEAADRLNAMGVTQLGILSAVVEMPEGQGRN